MAIGARITPELIVFGHVARLDRQEYDGKYTGTRVTIETDGGPLQVKWRADADNVRPEVGNVVAVLTSAFDGERGSSLTFERFLNGGDLDAIAKSFQPAQKAA